MFLQLSCTGEKPGDPVTTGLRQFLADDFSFKYANDATLDVRGEQGNVHRAFTINGPEIVIGDQSQKSYRIDLKVYHHNNANLADFLMDVFPETSEDNFTRVRVRGEESFRFETLEEDVSFIHTGIMINDKVIVISMQQEPQSPRSIYYLTLDSMRFAD